MNGSIVNDKKNIASYGTGMCIDGAFRENMTRRADNEQEETLWH